jgi:hypothetical protein
MLRNMHFSLIFFFGGIKNDLRVSSECVVVKLVVKIVVKLDARLERC